jgi:hypothetical protein
MNGCEAALALPDRHSVPQARCFSAFQDPIFLEAAMGALHAGHHVPIWRLDSEEEFNQVCLLGLRQQRLPSAS